MASIKRVGFSPAQNNTADLFKALGHPARIAILELISNDRLPCKHVEIQLELSKSTISRHMQILFDAGIIGYNKILNETYYFVNPLALTSAADYLAEPIIKNENQNFENVHFKIPEGITNPKL